jgi:hypothetical protein
VFIVRRFNIRVLLIRHWNCRRKTCRPLVGLIAGAGV